jgi:ABC-type Fe3+-citrate transport system substrate-binding protein
MTISKHSHQHPDYNKRIKALEKLVKRLGKELGEIRKRLKTHRHPHIHSR